MDWHEYVDRDERLERPSDVERLQGSAAKAKRLLGWEATTRFRRLVRLMVEADLRLVGVEPEGVLSEP